MPNMTEQQKNKMLQVLQDKGRVVIEEELPNDRNWVTASKNVYKMLNGSEFKGNDADAAKAGIDIMSKFNYNLGLGTIPQSIKLESADHIQKASMLYLLDTYEQKEPTKAGFGRALQEVFTDPTSLFGVTSLGTGFLARSGTKYATKEGIRAMLVKSIQSYIKSNTAMAATGGAVYGTAQNLAEQNVRIKAGVQKDINKKEALVTGAVGAVVGGSIGKGVEVATPYVKKRVNEVGNKIGQSIDMANKAGEEAMAISAGGGTPPSEYSNMTLYHGTNAEFDKFEANYPRQAKGNFKGVYFADNESEALDYGSSIKKAQADIKNPLIGNPYEEYAKSIGVDFESNRFKIKKADVEKWIDKNKFDSIIIPSGTQYNMKGNEVIILDPSILKETK